MAKRQQTDADDDTKTLFPELERSNPKHRALIKLAKDFDTKRKAHADGIATLKETRDNAEARLLSALHDAGMMGFIYKGVKANIEQGKEKVEVKVEAQAANEPEELETETPATAGQA